MQYVSGIRKLDWPKDVFVLGIGTCLPNIGTPANFINQCNRSGRIRVQYEDHAWTSDKDHRSKTTHV